MYRLLPFLGLCVAVGRNPGRSPNADLIEKLIEDGPNICSSDDIVDALLDVPALVRRYNYPLQVHHVVTSDGYILEMHRIPHGRDTNQLPVAGRPAVLLMHGLLSSSADFVGLGPGRALAYILAEEGYDVWLGNARGNYYSRRHVTLDPDGENVDFWRFSWEQIGLYDLSAMTDYIIQVTGQRRIQYIGHSQGGTVFLVLNSLRPKYNDKFISFHGLAPASYFKNNENFVYNFLAPFEPVLEPLAFQLGYVELMPRNKLLTLFGIAACAKASPFQPLCAAAVDLTPIGETLNASLIPVYLGHRPAGASIRQPAHYGQTINLKVFARFDYNPNKNLLIYGSINPPEFNVTRITVPTYLYYGLGDQTVNWKDIRLLGERLGNTVGLFRAERESFNHLDFVWGKNAKEEIYDKLILLLKEAENAV